MERQCHRVCNRSAAEKRQVRDDYRELLELSVVFLGGTPPRGIRFQYPGAIHRARWMARAIYSLKMWLFHKQYEPLQLGSKRLQKSCGPSHRKQMRKHLNEVCLFVTGMYIKYWFQSPSSAAAPRNDLNLLCTLSAYPNRKVAEAATTAFGRHLCYLSELLIGFAFFDDDVSIEEKRLMVMALVYILRVLMNLQNEFHYSSVQKRRDYMTSSRHLPDVFPDPRPIRRILKG